MKQAIVSFVFGFVFALALSYYFYASQLISCSSELEHMKDTYNNIATELIDFKCDCEQEHIDFNCSSTSTQLLNQSSASCLDLLWVMLGFNPDTNTFVFGNYGVLYIQDENFVSCLDSDSLDVRKECLISGKFFVNKEDIIIDRGGN